MIQLKHWLLFGCTLVMVIGMFLALSSRSAGGDSAPAQDPVATVLPLEIGAPHPTAQSKPSRVIVLRPERYVELPKNLIVSTGTAMEDFENPREWKVAAGLPPVANRAEFKNGSAGLKINGGKNGTVVEKRVSWDLSGTHQIRLWAYTPARVRTGFEIDLVTAEKTNAFFSRSVTITGPGWTLVQIGREEFSPNGPAQWSQPVTVLRLKVDSKVEMTFDSLFVGVESVPVVMLNFDDALESTYAVAFPILQKYGLVATVYAPTALVGTQDHLTVAQLLELQEAGWVVGNHTANHLILKGLSQADQEKQLKGALATLTSWGLTGGKFVAFPNGKYDASTLAAMETLGLLTGRTVSNAPDLFPLANPLVLRATQDVSGWSLDEVERLVDHTRASGGTLTLLFHEVVPGTSLEGGEWNAGMLEALADDLVRLQMATPTIADFYRLSSENVRVHVGSK